MTMTVDDVVRLRDVSPAWRLLRADSAPYVAAFLHRVFVADNRRGVPERDLVDLLDDFLYRVRQSEPDVMPRTPRDYLREWADMARFGWLRSNYPEGADEPVYDLTPAAERALVWLEGLTERTFIGTESRLLTLLELLRAMVEGTETDPAARLRALQARRDAIDADIAAVASGQVPVLDDAAIRDRFQQFEIGAYDLLRDFRAVEENFRSLDREVRERIAGWEGSRGELLATVFTERDTIAESDQGKSFRAFWDLLMSSDRQDELEGLLATVLALPAIDSPRSDLAAIVSEWLTAGGAVQRTVAQLSKQMRRFLDTAAYLDNRRIAELVRSIEASALVLRDDAPTVAVAAIAESKAEVNLPMMRTLRQPVRDVQVDSDHVSAGDDGFSTDDLFNQVAVDPLVLRQAVDRALSGRDQVSLAEVVAQRPLQLGLAELVAYLKVADDDGDAVIDESSQQRITWQADGGTRSADVPLVVFTARTGGARG